MLFADCVRTPLGSMPPSMVVLGVTVKVRGGVSVEQGLPDSQVGGYWSIARLVNSSNTSQWIEIGTPYSGADSLYIRTNNAAWHKLV